MAYKAFWFCVGAILGTPIYFMFLDLSGHMHIYGDRLFCVW